MGEFEGFRGENDEIEPGFYTFSGLDIGAAKAEVEQKRAELLDALRVSNCFAVAILGDDGVVINSSMMIGIDEGDNRDPECFLAYAALKIVKDLSIIREQDMDQTLQMLRFLVKRGVGEDW